MGRSIQVFYPTENGSSFDHDYYMTRHMEVVANSFGPHVDTLLLTRGLARGPDVPATYHVVATITFADQAALEAALAVIAPAVEDIPNFFSGTPQIFFGDVVAPPTS